MNGVTQWNIAETLYDYSTDFLEEYGLPIGHTLILLLGGLYKRLTTISTVVFFLKYVPTGFYMFKLLRSVYESSRERIKQKQTELEDIQLQIQIVNTKLSVRDSEFSERAEELRRCAARLRAVRARVRRVIDADDALRRVLSAAAPSGDEPDLQLHSTPEEEREFIVTLIKELKSERVVMPDGPLDKMDCGEPLTTPGQSTPDSVYSSLSDAENSGNECRVKIVKVTNVYKVAYLKHYIKQKRLRRATQQALLKKKLESIKKLLEGWQKSLNAVINNKLMLDSSTAELTSQEAMGDYKPNVQLSESDTELKTVCEENSYFGEYSVNWSTSHPYRSYSSPFTYEEMSEASQMCKELYEAQEANDMRYISHSTREDERPRSILFMLPEETTSQVAIEEIKDEKDTDNCASHGIAVN